MNIDIENSYGMKKSEAFGLLKHDEVIALSKLCVAVANEYPIFINVGMGFGISALVMTESNDNAIIYSVDKSLGGPLGGVENEKNAFRDTGLSLPIQLVGDSYEVGMRWIATGLPYPVDLILIDGDHTEAGIMRDINAYVPLLDTKNGIIAFHDYESEYWPDVKPVIDRTFGTRFMIHAGTLVAFRAKDIKKDFAKASQ